MNTDYNEYYGKFYGKGIDINSYVSFQVTAVPVRLSGDQIELGGRIARFARVAFIAIALVISKMAYSRMGVLPWIGLNIALIAVVRAAWKIEAIQKAIDRYAFVQALGGSMKFDAIPCYDGKSFTVETTNHPWKGEGQTTKRMKTVENPANISVPVSIGQSSVDGSLIAIVKSRITVTVKQHPNGCFKATGHNPGIPTVELISDRGYSTYGIRGYYDRFRCFETIRGIPLLRKLWEPELWEPELNDTLPCKTGTGVLVTFKPLSTIELGVN